MNMLADAQEWLTAQRHQHLTNPVVYQRGGVGLVVQATVGRSQFDVHDGYGGTLRVESRDYLIRSEDLVLGGERTLPVSGDPGTGSSRRLARRKSPTR